MASGKIKGITIELDGDTTKLNKALSSSENAAHDSVKALREIEKSLKFNPGNTKLVEQQQRNLAEAISATKEKLKILQDADGQMKRQLNDGKISVGQYEAFQREIITTKGQLSNYEKRLSSSQSEQKRLEQATKNLSTIFEASGTKIDDFADILGKETVEAFKKGEGSSKQMEDALQKLGDTLLGTGGDSEKLKQNLDRLGDGVSFDQLQKEAVDSGAKLGEMGESAKQADKTIEDLNYEAVQISGIDAAIDLFGKLKDAALDATGSIMDAWGNWMKAKIPSSRKPVLLVKLQIRWGRFFRTCIRPCRRIQMPSGMLSASLTRSSDYKTMRLIVRQENFYSTPRSMVAT